jgi:methyltransferase-like protein
MDDDIYPSYAAQVAATVANDQEVIVLTDSGQVTVLNELGTLIWQFCDGTHTIQQIVQVIIEEYEIDRLTAEHDVNEFLQQMAEMQALMLEKNRKLD